MPGIPLVMSEPTRSAVDEQRLDLDDDTLPPEHPAGSESTVSAGEILSGEGLGSPGAASAPHAADEPSNDTQPSDNS
jgi:hypothetical protein